MKKIRKICALLLVLTMAFSLAACSKSNEPTGRGESNVTGEVTQSASNEPVELVVYSQLANYSGEQEVPEKEEKPTSRVERYQKGMDFFGNSSGFGGDLLSSAFEMAEAGLDMDSAVRVTDVRES